MSELQFIPEDFVTLLTTLRSTGLEFVVDEESETILCRIQEFERIQGPVKVLVEFKRKLFCVTATPSEFEKIDAKFFDRIVEFTVRVNNDLYDSSSFIFDMKSGALSTRNVVEGVFCKPTIEMFLRGFYAPLLLYSKFYGALKRVLEENANVAEAIEQN